MSEAGFIRPMDVFYGKSYFLMLLIGAVAATPLLNKLFQKLPAKARNILSPLLILVVLVISTAYLVDATYNPFLYFRF